MSRPRFPRNRAGWLTVAEAAYCMGLSIPTVRAMQQRNELSGAVHLNRVVYLPITTVREYLDAQKCGHATLSGRLAQFEKLLETHQPPVLHKVR